LWQHTFCFTEQGFASDTDYYFLFSVVDTDKVSSLEKSKRHQKKKRSMKISGNAPG